MTDVSDLIARLRYSRYEHDNGIGDEAADALEAQAHRLVVVEKTAFQTQEAAKEIAGRLAAAERERDELIGMREEVLHYQREFHRLRGERDEAAALLRWCDEHWQNHIYEGSPSVHFLSRLAAFLAADSATHRENANVR